MQRLNIPLARHTKTTRRNRRVVWLLALGLLVFGVLVSRIGALWFSRDEIFSLAPAKTALAVELQINTTTAPLIASLLEDVPLISLRSLELTDLLPFIHGSLALFLTQDGDRSVAIRAAAGELPDFLAAYGITAQQQGRFVLLSNTLLPISGLSSRVRKPFLPSMAKTWLGRIELPDLPLGGSITYDETNISLEFPERQQDGTVARAARKDLAISLAMNPPQDSILPAFERLTESFSGKAGAVWPEITASGEVVVQIRPAETGLETLMIFKKTDVSKQAVIEQLQIMGAFSRPVIDSTALPDGTHMEEILVQPELVPIEEISTKFGLGYRVVTGSGKALVVAWDAQDLLLTNSETLLGDYATSNTHERRDPVACSGDNGYLDPSFLLSQVTLQQYDPSYQVLAALFDEIQGISVEFKKYSTKVVLCSS